MKFNFIFKKYRKSQIIICDRNYNKINFHPYRSFFLDNKEINLFYLLTVFKNYFFNKKCKTLKQAYLLTIINKIEAKIIIDNLESFTGANLKKIASHLKLIVSQNGIYFKQTQNKINISLSLIRPDYCLVWAKNQSKIIKRNVQTIITGSIKNNEQIYFDKKNKIYDLMFISEFRKIDDVIKKKQIIFNNFSDHIKNNYSYLNFTNVFIAQTLILLQNYSKQNKKKLSIAMASSREDKKHKISFNDEELFFKNLAPSCIITNLNSEELANKSKLLICNTSNFGMEMIAKGHKVLFLNFNHDFFDIPFKMKNGPFWQKDFNETETINKIKRLTLMSNQNYKKLVSKYFFHNYFDKNNIKLKKLIKNIIEK